MRRKEVPLEYQRYEEPQRHYANDSNNGYNNNARFDYGMSLQQKPVLRRGGSSGQIQPQYSDQVQHFEHHEEPYFEDSYHQVQKSPLKEYMNRVTTSTIPPPQPQPQPQDFSEPYIYQQGPEIGRGAYGVVYQGLDVKSGGFMAVKKLKFDDDKVKVDIQNEINLMSKLKHENIVAYLGADQKEGSLHIFMEYVPGGSISNVIKHFKRLHESVVRQYTKKILNGLQYLHRNNIVHGDIKAANILINNDGVVKLSDFGHSRVVQQGNSISESIRGTPMWMAPEVITDSRHGKPSDIWSLGCTIIEMITGDLPWPEFSKLEPFAIMYRIAQTKTGPEVPEDLGEDGRDFLRRCFEVNCNQRATVEQLLAHPFVTTEMDCWQESPSPQSAKSISSVSIPEPIQRRPSVSSNSPPSIQSELSLMTERIEKILNEQKPHTPPKPVRVQSSPLIGADLSPVGHTRMKTKRKSHPTVLDSVYSSYNSQYASHQSSYMSSYMSQQSPQQSPQPPQQQQQQQQQQQSYKQNQRSSRYAPPDNGEMSTEYMYPPQKGM